MCYEYFYQEMHIKAFLKKISENSNQQLPNRHSSPLQSSFARQFQTLNIRQRTSLTLKSIPIATKNKEESMKYIEHHSPAIKMRLNRSIKTNEISYEVSSHKFRKRIEERLMELMNQRKELVVLRASPRKEGSTSIHYSSHKDIKNKTAKEIPDFVKNIMKPCKVTTVNICNRPSTGIKVVRSQPKIYCKKLLPSRMSQKRIDRKLKTSENGLRESPSLRRYKTKAEPILKIQGWNKEDDEADASIFFL